jgi:hypothetical protein
MYSPSTLNSKLIYIYIYIYIKETEEEEEEAAAAASGQVTGNYIRYILVIAEAFPQVIRS